tara:strand:- start:92 stop:259 length:168 start_codon:yes stop_codon:yes gene_type:complete
MYGSAFALYPPKVSVPTKTPVNKKKRISDVLSIILIIFFIPTIYNTFKRRRLPMI